MKGQAMTDTRQALEEAWERITIRPPSYAFACSDDSNSDETLRQLGKQVWDWAERKARFRRFLDAEAWTDAAMMLVPEGWLWEVQWIGHQTKGRVANAHIWKRFDQSHFAAAAHPALALAQACLKARENSDG